MTIDNSTSNNLLLDTDHGVGTFTFGNSGTRESAFTVQTGPLNKLTISSGVVANADFDTSGMPLALRGKYTVGQNQNWSIGGDDGTALNDRGAVVRAAEDELVTGELKLDGNLTKTGTGQLSFLGISVSGPGNIIVNDGALRLHAGGGLPLGFTGSGGLTINSPGKLFTLRSSGSFGTCDRPITLTGTAAWTHESHSPGASVIGSPVLWNGSTHTFTVDANLTLSGAWTGGATVNKSGPDFLVLTGSSPAFTGTLRNSSGNLQIDNLFHGHLDLRAGATTLNAKVDGNVTVNPPGSTPPVLILNGPSDVARIGGNLTAEVSTISGEILVAGNISLEDVKLGVNPQTSAMLSATGNLSLDDVTVAFDAMPTSTASFPVAKCTGTLTLVGGTLASVFDLDGGQANYRTPVFSLNGTKQVDLSLGSPVTLIWRSDGTDAWNFTATGNWNGSTSSVFRQLDHVIFDDTAANVVVSMGSGLGLRPASVTFNCGDGNHTEVAGPGYVTGGASITKNGLGEVTWGGGNSQNFTGPVTVNGGTLRMGSNAALGFASKIEIANGASVNLNGRIPFSAARGGYTYHIAGSGPDGNGAIVNYSGTAPQGRAGIKSLVLTGDALISSEGRYDIGFDAGQGFGTITGNNHTLTIRTLDVPLDSSDSGATGMAIRGDASGSTIRFVVEAGVAWAEDSDKAFGGANGTLTIKGGARAGTYGERSIATPVIIEEGGMLHNQGVNLVGGTGRWTGGITLAGDAMIHTGGRRIVVASAITESSVGRTLTKLSGGDLVLAGDCSYTGETLVLSGGLLVNGNHGTGGAAAVTVNGGATLGGSGRIHGITSVAGTLAPGEWKGNAAGTNPIATLRTGPAALSGILAYDINGGDADKLEVDGNLNITGCDLVISPLPRGATLGTYTIATFTSRTGTFATTSGIPAGYSVVYSAGKIELINPSVTTSPYQTWAAAAGLGSSDAGPLDDKDKDGKNNITEFAFNDFPLAGTSSSNWGCRSSSVGGQAVLTLTIQARANASFQKNPPQMPLVATIDGVRYHVEGSTGLGDWARDVTEVTNAAELSVIRSGMPAPPAGWSYYTFRSPGAVGTVSKDFLRAWAEPAP